jgi:glycosyltransferase involved in cell wall biosynthesis
MPVTPKATVVIPCFNHGRFVADAVRSCLAQTDAQVRIVIVDDGSTDGESAARCDACAEMAASVRVVHQPNRGLPAARNAGAAIASREDWGEYLVFLDADDWIERTFVSRLHREIENSPAPDVSHAYCQEKLVERGTGVWKVPAWDPMLLLVTNLHPVTTLIKRTHFERSGGFDESFRRGYEDWDLWLRFSEHGWRGVRVREPLFNWRRHSENTLVMQAAMRHAELHGAIVERHTALYERNARKVIELSNVLLRRADANWLDENGEAIFVRDLRSRNCELFDELEAAHRKIAELESAVDDYRHKPAVRLSKAVFNIVDALPRPFGEPVRSVARWTRRVLSKTAL